MSPEEMQAYNREKELEMFSKDDAARDLGSKRAVTITLVQEPETRRLFSGDTMVILRGTQEGQTNPSKAVYIIPPRVENSMDKTVEFDAMMRDLGGGDKVSLAGQWSKRNWKDQAGESRFTWEFKTQHFAKGDMPLESILEKARIDRGEKPSVDVAQAQDVSKAASRKISPAEVQRNSGIGV